MPQQHNDNHANENSIDDNVEQTSKLHQPTEQEITWALAIREAAKADEMILHEDMTDWEYLQCAIVAKGNVLKALKRIRRMQVFKRRYGIQRDGCLADAERDVSAMMGLHPGFWVSLASLEKKENGCSTKANAVAVLPQVFCVQYKNIRARSFKSEEAHAIFLRACFYALQACQHNVAALRGGVYAVADTRETSWKNLSLQARKRTLEVFSDAYPVRLHNTAILFASPTVRFFHTLCRSLMNLKFQHLTVLYSHQESQSFLQSQTLSPEVLPSDLGGCVAPDKLYDTIMLRLEERYNNAANFQL